MFSSSLKLPDPWQHLAVDHLRAGSDVIVSAPTGAGKTYIFELIYQSGHFKAAGQTVYTVPTRALANDKYAEWRDLGWNVGIATGDLAENVNAPVLVATLETQVERLLRGEGPALLVIDEYQMIADAGRGAHYEGTIALAPNKTRLLLLSGSVSNPDDVAEWMRRIGRPAEVVATKHRPVPLEEMPLELLPMHLARKFEGWWPQLAAAAILGDLAPLLIFSPRRRDAESIARALAHELPQGEPLSLTAAQAAACGKELTAMLEKRIAFHHSGLSYAARAGVIEPLAKAGQLRVIVATMGLAAGINFSVRSVHVAATKFHDGTSEQALDPDELLQMFGRAGRRGLDDHGYVITTRQSPTLGDGRPARLHRSALLAWPMFLRVMKHAALRGDDAFDAAQRFAMRLFADEPPALGLETTRDAASPLPPITRSHEGTATFGLEAMVTQIFNSGGEWEERHSNRTRSARLGEVWIADESKQSLAVAHSRFIASLGGGLARLFKIEADVYGLEVALGQPVAEGSEVFRPTRALRKLLHLGREEEDLSLDEFTKKHRLKVARKLKPSRTSVPRVSANERDTRSTDLENERDARSTYSHLPAFIDHAVRDGLLLARWDMRDIPVEAYADNAGRLILQPLERSVPRHSETEVDIKEADGTAEKRKPIAPRPGSPIHAWRSLGLIDAHGVPTQRGEIVSFFQHGEGLAIAAALEDESYHVDEMVEHMANLRAGFRFELPGFCASERLGAACRAAYGFINHQGYLANGLPIDYGEGAAEVLAALMHQEHRKGLDFQQGFAEGDVSRAYLEWLSLIRHIVHAPHHAWPRWQALQAECARVLKDHGKAMRHLFHLDIPPLTAKQKHGRPMHYLLAKK